MFGIFYLFTALVIFSAESVRSDRCYEVCVSRARIYSINGRYVRQGVSNGYDVFRHVSGHKYLYHVGYYWVIGRHPSYQLSHTYLRSRDLTRDPDDVRAIWEEKDRYNRWMRNVYLDVDCSDDSRHDDSFDDSRYDSRYDNSRYDNSRDNSRYNSRDKSRYENSRDNSRYDNSRDDGRHNHPHINNRYDTNHYDTTLNNNSNNTTP